MSPAEGQIRAPAEGCGRTGGSGRTFARQPRAMPGAMSS
jgi:hypothetical protein